MYKYNEFSDYGYNFILDFKHEDIPLSEVFYNPSLEKVLIIDKKEIFSTKFSYKRYCQMQNELMNKYKRVYRFIEDDSDILKFLKASLEEGNEYSLKKTYNREDNSLDPTPIEADFEMIFEETYGREALNYLLREYSFITYEGNTAYIDYALFKKDGSWVAIEENGVSYHHPFIISAKNYRKILKKQNSVIENNGIVFRWDTDSIKNAGKIADELKEFIGDINNYIYQYRLKSTRGFQLYEHQGNYLKDLEKGRQSGKKAALVVLPTGTGKTVVALEDLSRRGKNNDSFSFMVIVPTLDLVMQWGTEISKYPELINKSEVITYAGAARKYFTEDAKKYDYIIVDEAHHAVAPVLKKTINHYQPDFLLGLTATDKRLDARKLESVFNEYEEKINLKEAIEKGLLSQIRAYRLETNIDLSEVRFNGKDYINADLEKRVRVASRNELIADVVNEYFNQKLSGKSGLIFCVNVDHAKEMAALLKKKGISAESVDGTDKKRFEKIVKYMKKEVQFLCTCSLLNEGWDAPHTSVIVMARPTMSKVLYTQQLGRGTRNYPGKEALYIIDVVDSYGAQGQISNRPWSVHSLLEIQEYRKFRDMIKRDMDSWEEIAILDTTHEEILKLQPYDLFTFEKDYGDYLSAEQLARELFISTETLMDWYRKKKLIADLELPMGKKKLLFFNPERLSLIREEKGLKLHNEETIVADFWDYVSEGSYTFSYKILFILSFLETVDSTGDADIKLLMEDYRNFYLQRIAEGKPADRVNSPYNNKEYLMDERTVIQSILKNSFEKFERKKFMYYSKDLSKISLHHRIWDDLINNNGMDKLKKLMKNDLDNYYSQL